MSSIHRALAFSRQGVILFHEQRSASQRRAMDCSAELITRSAAPPRGASFAFGFAAYHDAVSLRDRWMAERHCGLRAGMSYIGEGIGERTPRREYYPSSGRSLRGGAADSFIATTPPPLWQERRPVFVVAAYARGTPARVSARESIFGDSSWPVSARFAVCRTPRVGRW